MNKLLTYALLLTGLLTSACSVHKIDIQQGNIVTPEMIEQVNPGMTKRQVEFILGTPLIIDSFNNDHWVYYYRLQSRDENVEQYHITLDFEDDKLIRMDDALLQKPAPEAAAHED